MFLKHPQYCSASSTINNVERYLNELIEIEIMGLFNRSGQFGHQTSPLD